MSESTSLRRSASGFLRPRASADAAPVTTMPRTRGGLINARVPPLPGAAVEAALTRPLCLAFLLGPAALSTVALHASDNPTDFFAAAVKSGTESLRAWLFGSLDAANAITVDKPPASLWVMVLSARIFGYSSWSMLVPQ